MQKARRHIIQDAPTACRRTVSGTLSLPCKGYFSPFPHGTGSLSVSYEYLALPDGPGGFTQDYSCPALLRSPLRFGLLRVRGCHPLWRGFPVASTHGLSCDGAVLQPRRCRDNVGLGSSPVARHYWGNHSLFSFPAGTKMFQFPAFASRIGGIISLQDIGLSHSEIRGSRAICASPRLFAAYHVLHRLYAPRHPPYALHYFRLYCTSTICLAIGGTPEKDVPFCTCSFTYTSFAFLRFVCPICQ